ncbi:MAG: peptide chain release factor N(5)-glutamine methyltransferase, partial [Polyangiaceae bacterium]
MTLAAALAVGIMRLRSGEAASEVRGSARADAQLMLGEVLKADAAWMLAHGERSLDRKALDDFGLLLDERMRGVPIAYLTRKAGFHGREFYVDDRVLVPRPESELMVEAALTHLRATRGRTSSSALDVGTGSGALAITLAAEMTELDVTATDVSDASLQVARRNARAHGVEDRIRFIRCDLADALDGARFDCILANLPYVPSADVPFPPDPAGYEPQLALDGGDDGLALYRRLLPKLPPLVTTGGGVFLEDAPPTIGELSRL